MHMCHVTQKQQPELQGYPVMEVSLPTTRSLLTYRQRGGEREKERERGRERGRGRGKGERGEGKGRDRGRRGRGRKSGREGERKRFFLFV